MAAAAVARAKAIGRFRICSGSSQEWPGAKFSLSARLAAMGPTLADKTQRAGAVQATIAVSAASTDEQAAATLPEENIGLCRREGPTDGAAQ
eukprot:2787963-Pyramimonas_sp.AAC.1